MEQGNHSSGSSRFLGLCIIVAAVIIAVAIFCARGSYSCPSVKSATVTTPPSQALAPAMLPPTGRYKAFMGERQIGWIYLRCENRKVVWLGESLAGGQHWTNIFNGTVGDDGSIRGEWYDVPRGYNAGSGKLVARYDAKTDSIIVAERTGGFSTTVISRVPPGTEPLPPELPPSPVLPTRPSH